MFKFGERSSEYLKECVAELRLILSEAIKISSVDFGISQAARTIEQQQKYYDAGKSKINPKKYSNPDDLAKIAKHIVTDNYPFSRAVDIFVVIKGKPELAYDENHLCYIGGLIMSTAKSLKNQGKIKSTLRWGANWDMDGEIITDQSFDDLPHFEIYEKTTT